MTLLLSSFILSIDKKLQQPQNVIDILDDIGADVGQLNELTETKKALWNDMKQKFICDSFDKTFVNFIYDEDGYKCANIFIENIIKKNKNQIKNLNMYDFCFGNKFTISMAMTPNIAHLSCCPLLIREIFMFNGISSDIVNDKMRLPRIINEVDENGYYIDLKKWNSIPYLVRTFHIANCMNIIIKDDNYVLSILETLLNSEISVKTNDTHIILKSKKYNDLLPFCLSLLFSDFVDNEKETLSETLSNRTIGKISIKLFTKYFPALSPVVVAMHNRSIKIQKVDNFISIDFPSFLSINNEMQYIEEIYRNCKKFSVNTFSCKTISNNIEEIYQTFRTVLVNNGFNEVCSLPFSTCGVLCDNPIDKNNVFLRDTAILSFAKHIRIHRNENIFSRNTLFFEKEVIYSPIFLSLCEENSEKSFLDGVMHYIASQCFNKLTKIQLCKNNKEILSDENNQILVQKYILQAADLPLFIYSIFLCRGTIFKSLEINLTLLSQLKFDNINNMFISRAATLNHSFELKTFYFSSISEYINFLITFYESNVAYSEIYDCFTKDDKIKLTLRIYK